MRRYIYPAMTVFAILFCVQVFAEEGWIFCKEEDGIKTYTRKVENFPVDEAYGVGVVDADLETVSAFMTNLEAYFKYFKMVKKAYIADRLKDGTLIVYTHIAMPWPVWDRDTIAEYRVVREKDRVTIITTAIPTYPNIAPPGEKIIRMTDVKDVYVLTRQGDKTLLSIRSKADPAGDIPKSIINNLIGSGPINTITAIRNMLKDNKK